MNKKRNSNFKKIIIGTLVASFTLMIVAVVVLAQNILTITPAKIDIWDVRISKVEPVMVTEGAVQKSTPTYSTSTLSFDVEFTKPGEAITYAVTIKNTGTLDSRVSYIHTIDGNNNVHIKYTLMGIDMDTVIKAGETLNFTVKVEYELTNEFIYTDNPYYVDIGFEQLV